MLYMENMFFLETKTTGGKPTESSHNGPGFTYDFLQQVPVVQGSSVTWLTLVVMLAKVFTESHGVTTGGVWWKACLISWFLKQFLYNIYNWVGFHPLYKLNLFGFWSLKVGFLSTPYLPGCWLVANQGVRLWDSRAVISGGDWSFPLKKMVSQPIPTKNHSRNKAVLN